MITEHELDGVDYNWEYPGYSFENGYQNDVELQKDYNGLISLLKESRAALNTDKVITMAYYPDTKQERLLFEGKADLYCDFLHMMTYDQKVSVQSKTHSTLEFATRSIQNGIKSGLNSKKLTLGVPFYGRHSVTGDWTTYEDIVQKYHPLDNEMDIILLNEDSHKNVHNNIKKQTNTQGYIGFNGINSINKKVQLVQTLGIGGIMIWEVGQDCRVTPTVRNGKTHPITCPNGELSSLLVAINRTLELNYEQMYNVDEL